MEDNNDDNFKNWNLDINYTAQKDVLENLMNKYNINTKKSESESISASSSQQSLNIKSNTLSRTNSSSSNASQKSVQQVSKTKAKDKPIRTTNKNKTPYKNVVTLIATELIDKYGRQILNEFDVLEINYEVRNHVCPDLITWTYLDTETDTDNNKEFKTVLLILEWKEVVNHISTNSFLQHVKSMSEILMGKRIILGLYGFENYFKYWRSQKQSGKHGKHDDQKFSGYKSSIKISRYELEYVLTELEIRYSCCHRFLENTQDIVNIISQFTKSIAQLPEKLEKSQKYKNFDFCMQDNKDCVLVDKNGNGYRRLWQQQLITFDLVRLETAEAIMSKYATPSELLEAYEKCNSKSEGVKLLEDIPIRRAAGPLTTTRRIGPDLSNKLYNFFNATDGSSVI